MRFWETETQGAQVSAHTKKIQMLCFLTSFLRFPSFAVNFNKSFLKNFSVLWISIFWRSDVVFCFRQQIQIVHQKVELIRTNNWIKQQIHTYAVCWKNLQNPGYFVSLISEDMFVFSVSLYSWFSCAKSKKKFDTGVIYHLYSIVMLYLEYNYTEATRLSSEHVTSPHITLCNLGRSYHLKQETLDGPYGQVSQRIANLTSKQVFLEFYQGDLNYKVIKALYFPRMFHFSEF